MMKQKMKPLGIVNLVLGMISIAFFVLGVLLLSVYPLRWEKGSVQTEGGLKIIHLQDRWTGQGWLNGKKAENNYGMKH